MNSPRSNPLKRVFPDPLAGALSPLVIDRQRVVHSAAFRRLQHKTQVFITLEADHHRTRLTHTLEVAHLARILAAGLDLDAELAEVVALAHDLGHAPFGHAGERALNECMHDHGGFEHNAHTLRVVEYLEHPIPEFRGLNLTLAVRECLAKHTTKYDRPGEHPLRDGSPPPPEGEVVDLADRLAYGLHDLQDGLYAGLLEPDALSDVELWLGAYDGPRGAGSGWRAQLRPTIERMQRTLVEDVLAESTRRRGAQKPAAAGRIDLSPAMDARLDALERFLLEYLYRGEPIAAADRRARQVLCGLFAAYRQDPALLPTRFAGRVAEQGIARVTADYIAGMTDRFALAEHERIRVR